MNLFVAPFDLPKVGRWLRNGRWFKQFREKNRSPCRWYENDIGLG